MSTRTYMTDKEFRSIVDQNGLHVDQAYDAWAPLRALTGMSTRTLRSYYYGERSIPQRIAVILHHINRGGSPTDSIARRRAFLSDTTTALEAIRENVAEMERQASDRDRIMLAHQKAVEAFCRWCEPEGICQNAKCALRPVSPIPISRRLTVVA